MQPDFGALPRAQVTIEGGESAGPLEWWRHAIGHGGINTLPLPEHVVAGTRKLQPRLIRIFLQECFAVYPARGRFDWSRLDPYMEAFAQTGAKLVAAITLKPPVLFPQVDHALWQPGDVRAWQQMIAALVRRYSVERPLVTHWEVGNEPDIGESGGCPYLIRSPEDYLAYYQMTIQPILETFPAARVGGPAAASVANEPLPGFIARCRQTGTQLDFVSWHLYHDDPRRHVAGVEAVKAALQGFPGPRPEMLVTEWNQGFPAVSVEEEAFVARRAANTAAVLLAMQEAGLDWSFYYHLWDQVFYPDPFRPFFSPAGLELMERHWNEVPHRFGLFGVGGEVRPQYFVYQMLGRLGGERIAVRSDHPDLSTLAGRSEGRIAALLVNFNLYESHDMTVTAQFAGLTPGPKLLTTYRIDAQRRWSAELLELLPAEQREVYTEAAFRCQIYCPADSVLLITLEERATKEKR
ncbi:MAG TPA: glycosyl hydrolase [Chthonomonadaceae bacterium]|nr:glycosyl hydrolase [Chthonomonadaceae bacterium]